MGYSVELPESLYHQLCQRAQERGTSISDLLAEWAQQEEYWRLAVVIGEMQAVGILLSSYPPMSPPALEWTPVQVRGEPVSETILRERR